MKKIILIFFIALTFIFILDIDSMAIEITNNCEIFLDNNLISTKILDNDESTFEIIEKESTIKIKAREHIAGIYCL